MQNGPLKSKRSRILCFEKHFSLIFQNVAFVCMHLGWITTLHKICLPTEGMSGGVGGLGVRVDRRRLLTTGGDTSGVSEGLRISSSTLSTFCLHQSVSRICSHVMRVFSSGSSIWRIRSRHPRWTRYYITILIAQYSLRGTNHKCDFWYVFGSFLEEM